jgi:membrane protease YdiL (CAAX protease family)
VKQALARALRRFFAPVIWAARRFFVDHWKIIDAEAEQLRRERGEGGALGYPSWRPLIVLVLVSVSLTVQEYWGDRVFFERTFSREPGDAYWSLKGFGWWSGWRFIGYVVMPVLVIWMMPGERVRDYFVSLRGFFKHLWIYLVLFLLLLPAVIIAAQTESFNRTYPFYKLANRSAFDLWVWQGMYALQFLSLEFFFRGFMLHGLRELGSRAIFVMLVPYCMIHFGKPWTETMGAIGAGIILGTLAMRTRSIWGGVLIHVGVALTMDLLALRHCPSAEVNLPCKGH